MKRRGQRKATAAIQFVEQSETARSRQQRCRSLCSFRCSRRSAAAWQDGSGASKFSLARPGRVVGARLALRVVIDDLPQPPRPMCPVWNSPQRAPLCPKRGCLACGLLAGCEGQRMYGVDVLYGCRRAHWYQQVAADRSSQGPLQVLTLLAWYRSQMWRHEKDKAGQQRLQLPAGTT